jgi:hypothetical protein
MKLYHYSNEKLTILIPIIGDARNEAEDPEVIGKPVVWLATTEMVKRQDRGVPDTYRYTVDIPEDDSNLHISKIMVSNTEIFEKFFDTRVGSWYYFTSDIDVLETEEWNGTEYVKVITS